MANHKSAKKSIKQNEKKRQVNKSRISRVRTFVKKVETSITASDQVQAVDALKVAQSQIMRAVSKGVLKLNTASRKISRLSHRIKKLAS